MGKVFVGPLYTQGIQPQLKNYIYILLLTLQSTPSLFNVILILSHKNQNMNIAVVILHASSKGDQ